MLDISYPKKVVFFQNLHILYWKSYSKFDGFWRLSVNLVVFLTDSPKFQLLESIVRQIFYRFWKTFFKVILFLVESSFLAFIEKMWACKWLVRFCSTFFNQMIKTNGIRHPSSKSVSCILFNNRISYCKSVKSHMIHFFARPQLRARRKVFYNFRCVETTLSTLFERT